MTKGHVYLVGAGPGDPGLLTVKGEQCLKRAQVVVYDRLVNPRLLSLAPAEAELKYAGKSPEGHTLSQQEINNLLVAEAASGKTVVRLKGGDPFVFGRGGEEAEALAEAGISFSVIPGISSAVAVPAYAGIPVTHRRLSSSLAVITGNEEPGKAEAGIEWSSLARDRGTLVFLMGRKNLAAICSRLIGQGKDPGTPAAAIERGTTAGQRTVTGALGDIAERVDRAGLCNPLVLVVGHVVGLRSHLNWREDEPLFGRRILVTRPQKQSAGLTRALEERGAEVLEWPAIEIVPPTDPGPLEQAVRQVADYDWLVFTSANGVKAFFDRLFNAGGDSRQIAGVKLAAIGAATAKALRGFGLRADVMPGVYVAEELLKALARLVSEGDRILLPRAAGARALLPQGLRGLGAQVDEVEAYRASPPAGGENSLRQLLQQNRMDVVVFTSSSTASNFAAMTGGEMNELLQGSVIASIGPITSRTLNDLGFRPAIQAQQATAAGLAEAIETYFAGRNLL